MSESTTPLENPLANPPPKAAAEKTLRTSALSTFIVMLGTALSRIMGYVRVFVFAYVFGSTGLADVIAAVIGIPESLRSLFAEGALSSAFIPTLSTALVRDATGERARRIVSNLFAFVLLILVPLCSLGVLFNTEVVNAIIHFNDTKLYLAASADGARLAAAADDGAFHVSADGGASWRDMRSEHKWAAFALSPEGSRAAGAVRRGLLYLSDDGGETWAARPEAGEREWSAVALSGDGAVLIAGAADGFLRVSADGGSTWREQTAEPWSSWTAAAVTPDGRTAAAAADGDLFVSADGGVAWASRPYERGRHWRSLALAPDGRTLLAAASDGRLYRSDDGGTAWTRLDGAGKREWSSVALAADGKTFLAAVSEGSFWQSADRGATWTERRGAGTYRWKMGLAEKLFPYDVWFLLFISLSAVLMGALNSKHVFVIPAVTPILFSVTVIASVLWLPLPIEYRMIAGIVSGGLAQVLFQIPSFLRARYRLLPDFRLNNPDFRRVLAQWLPVVMSASIFAINITVARAFASALEPGSITALYNAGIYFQLPLGIFANSVITVLFPRLSRQAALDDRDGLKETLRYGLRFMLVLLVPSTLLLVFLGEDVITLTLEHGAFTRAGTLQTAPVLAAFALGLFSTGALYLFQRLFYALKDYKRPVATAGLILVADVGLSFALKETPLRVAGLALANTVAFTGGLALFVFLARRRLGALGLRRTVRAGLKVLAGNVPLAGLVAVYFLLVRPATLGLGLVPRLAVLAGTVLAGFGVTFVMYLFLKVDIVEDRIRSRFGKKRRA